MKAIVAFGLAAGLAACTAGEKPAPQASKPATGVPEVLGGPPDKAGRAPDADAASAAPPAPAPRPAAGEAAGDVAAVRPGPKRSFPELVGLTDSEVRAELGAPIRISERPPALVWHYEFPGCRLQLFLFADVASGASKALTFEAAGEPTDAEIDSRCAGVLADG